MDYFGINSIDDFAKDQRTIATEHSEPTAVKWRPFKSLPRWL